MTRPLHAGLRWEVLRALEQARGSVAHGYPSLFTALRQLRLTERAWIEVDKALDDVRFTVEAQRLESAALSEGGKSAEGCRLRDELGAARRNARLPWESPEGLTREQTVALLFIAREFLKGLPVVSEGSLFPSLPIRSTST